MAILLLIVFFVMLRMVIEGDWFDLASLMLGIGMVSDKLEEFLKEDDNE